MGPRHLAAAVLSVALTGVALSVAACGDGVPVTTTAGAEASVTSSAPAGIPLGTEVTVDGFPGAIGSIRVSAEDRWTRSGRPLSDPPREGVYVQVKVTARSIGTAPFDFYPFDFYLADAKGNRYEYGLGNGWAEYSPDEVEGGRIRPGERVAGALLFDASPRVDRLVYAPLGRPVQSWHLSG